MAEDKDLLAYASNKFSLDPGALYAQKQSALNNQVIAAEQQMYRNLGLEQQKREDDIRKRRQMALKGGATSAQLAAQELQSLMAGQEGMMMAQNQMNQQRMNSDNALADYALNLSSIDAQRQAALVQDPVYQAEQLASKFGIDFNTAWKVARGETTLDKVTSFDADGGNLGNSFGRNWWAGIGDIFTSLNGLANPWSSIDSEGTNRTQYNLRTGSKLTPEEYRKLLEENMKK